MAARNEFEAMALAAVISPTRPNVSTANTRSLCLSAHACSRYFASFSAFFSATIFATIPSLEGHTMDPIENKIVANMEVTKLLSKAKSIAAHEPLPRLEQLAQVFSRTGTKWCNHKEEGGCIFAATRKEFLPFPLCLLEAGLLRKVGKGAIFRPQSHLHFHLCSYEGKPQTTHHRLL